MTTEKSPGRAPSDPKTMIHVTGTVAVWTGIIVLTSLFHSYGLLDGMGSALLVVVAFALTIIIWGTRCN